MCEQMSMQSGVRVCLTYGFENLLTRLRFRFLLEVCLLDLLI